MASTYEPITTQTLGSSSASVTFSTISGSYTDLVLVFNVSGSQDINVLMQFNGDTGSNYSNTSIGGSGSAAFSARYTGTNIQLNYQGYVNIGFNSNATVNILNYSNSTTYKTTINRFNNTGVGTDAVVGLWRNTAAITSIVLKTQAGTFATGSTFTLYGIAAA
jgi:hypothetical protein